LNADMAATLSRGMEVQFIDSLRKQMTADAAAGKLPASSYAQAAAAMDLASDSVDKAKGALALQPAAAPVATKYPAVPILDGTDQAKADGEWVLKKVLAVTDPDSDDLPKFVVVIDKGNTP
jgi:hypothetical protein